MKEPHAQFGVVPSRLPGSQLPTNADVIGRLLMLRIEKMEESSVKSERNFPMKECIEQVSLEILELWARASVPTREKCHVIADVTKLWKKKENIKKKSVKTQPEARARMQNTALADMHDLLDIASRVRRPELAEDREFLADQRGPRKLHIGGLDPETTGRWQRREQRKKLSSALTTCKGNCCLRRQCGMTGRSLSVTGYGLSSAVSVYFQVHCG